MTPALWIYKASPSLKPYSTSQVLSRSGTVAPRMSCEFYGAWEPIWLTHRNQGLSPGGSFPSVPWDTGLIKINFWMVWLWAKENQKYTTMNKNAPSYFYLHPLIAMTHGPGPWEVERSHQGQRWPACSHPLPFAVSRIPCLLCSPGIPTQWLGWRSHPVDKGHSHKLEKGAGAWACTRSLIPSLHSCLLLSIFMWGKEPWTGLRSIKTTFNTDLQVFQHGKTEF